LPDDNVGRCSADALSVALGKLIALAENYRSEGETRQFFWSYRRS
jgi:hypothetical protein